MELLRALELQEAPAGRPEQVNVTEPLAKFATVNVVEPDPPGEEMVTVVELVVTVGGGAGATVITKLVDAVSGVLSESETRTVKLPVLGCVGVPEMAPVPALRVNPSGRLLGILQVYGGTPPVAASVAE